MRRPITISLLFLVAGVLAACSGGKPVITVETDRLDLGDVPNGQIAARDLTVRNTGDAVLVVEGLSTSCGCTTAAMEPMQLAPGASGTLHIEMDTGAHGPELTGPLVRQVFVKSNDPAQPDLVVELAVNITPPLVGDGR
jgi:hypothetical protein